MNVYDIYSRVFNLLCNVVVSGVIVVLISTCLCFHEFSEVFFSREICDYKYVQVVSHQVVSKFN